MSNSEWHSDQAEGERAMRRMDEEKARRDAALVALVEAARATIAAHDRSATQPQPERAYAEQSRDHGLYQIRAALKALDEAGGAR